MQYEHDAVGNIAATIYSNGTQQFRLPDAVGNLFTSAARTDRRYGPAGQLLEAKGTRYAYDALGNLSHKTTPTGQQWRYGWNAAGLSAEVVRPNGEVVRFTYAPLGRRVSKSYQGKTTRWVWDGNVPLHEWTELALNGMNTDDLITWLFEAENFAPLAKLTPQADYSVVSDHLGTPLELHDAQGRLYWSAELDSYGAVRQRQTDADVAACPFRYQGQYEDSETGLYYNRFRYYDPEAGQYISQDPIGLVGGNALYGYVRDTGRQIDVLGLSGFDPFSVGEITPFPKDIHFGQNRISPNFSSIGSQASDKIRGRPLVGLPLLSSLKHYVWLSSIRINSLRRRSGRISTLLMGTMSPLTTSSLGSKKRPDLTGRGVSLSYVHSPPPVLRNPLESPPYFRASYPVATSRELGLVSGVAASAYAYTNRQARLGYP
jgi:RHS repeat-associated protein